MTERQGKEMLINREEQLLKMTEGREKMVELLKTISTKETAANTIATASTLTATTRRKKKKEWKEELVVAIQMLVVNRKERRRIDDDNGDDRW